MQLITALKMEKIKLLFSLMFFTISISLFSQKNNEIVYIEFNKSKDNHVSKKGSINYFDICIDNNKYVRFQYGIYNVKTVQEFNFKIMNRIELSEFLKKDNPNKNINYIIIDKVKNSYNLYESDHLIRKIVD
jgi:hypothetical protein